MNQCSSLKPNRIAIKWASSTALCAGASGLGKQDLILKLVRDHTDYTIPLPVTSRPKKLLEADGKEYTFISKNEMDKLVSSNRLLEYGEYKGHIYGIALDSILDVISMGRVCVLTCQAQSLPTLRCSAIKPFVVLIKPPALEKLKSLRIYTGERSSKKLTISDMEEMVLGSAKIESIFSDLCDEVIINTDFSTSYKCLVSTCQRLYTEESWIPSSWVSS